MQPNVNAGPVITEPGIESVVDLFLGLEAQGVRLERVRRWSKWKLEVDGPESTLTDELLERIRRNRAPLMDLLKSLEQGGRIVNLPEIPDEPPHLRRTRGIYDAPGGRR